MGGLVGWSFTMRATRGKRALPKRRRKLELHLFRSSRLARVAVLIDAENVSVGSAHMAMGIARNLGHVTVGRAYGNAVLLQSGSWKRLFERAGLKSILPGMRRVSSREPAYEGMPWGQTKESETQRWKAGCTCQGNG